MSHSRAIDARLRPIRVVSVVSRLLSTTTETPVPGWTSSYEAKPATQPRWKNTGWPSTCWEFLPLVEPLTAPDGAGSFDVRELRRAMEPT